MGSRFSQEFPKHLEKPVIGDNGLRSVIRTSIRLVAGKPSRYGRQSRIGLRVAPLGIERNGQQLACSVSLDDNRRDANDGMWRAIKG